MQYFPFALSAVDLHMESMIHLPILSKGGPRMHHGLTDCQVFWPRLIVGCQPVIGIQAKLILGVLLMEGSHVDGEAPGCGCTFVGEIVQVVFIFVDGTKRSHDFKGSHCWGKVGEVSVDIKEGPEIAK